MSGYIELNGKKFTLGGEGGYFAINGQKFPMDSDTALEAKEWMESGHRILTLEEYPTCPKCGHSGEDDWEYCPFDGTKLNPPGPPIRYEVDERGDKVGSYIIDNP